MITTNEKSSPWRCNMKLIIICWSSLCKHTWTQPLHGGSPNIKVSFDDSLRMLILGKRETEIGFHRTMQHEHSVRVNVQQLNCASDKMQHVCAVCGSRSKEGVSSVASRCSCWLVIFSSLSVLAWLDFDPTLLSSLLLSPTLCCLCKAILHIVLSFLGMFLLALIALVVQTHHEM